MWKFSSLVVIMARCHAFTPLRCTFYVNRLLYIPRYIRIPDTICPRGIMKFSFHTLFPFPPPPPLSFPTLALSCSSEYLYLSDRSIDPFICLFLRLFRTSLCFTLCFSISIPISLSHFSDSPFLLSHPSCLSLFTLFIYYISPSTNTRSTAKSLMSDVYRGFHGSAVKLYSGISFSREHAHATWRHGVPQAVLFCHIVRDYLADAF